MAATQEFLSVLGEFRRSKMLFSVIVLMELLKNARIVITHVYYNALTLAVSLGGRLNPRPGGLGFKQLPRATANVNA